MYQSHTRKCIQRDILSLNQRDYGNLFRTLCLVQNVEMDPIGILEYPESVNLQYSESRSKSEIQSF